MTHKRVLNLIILVSIFFDPNAYAAGYTLRVGAASMGTGQANPVTFVAPYEYEFTYNTKSNYEFRLSPGSAALFGKKFETKSTGAYIGLGGGFLYDFNSPGIGVYSALGYDFFCGTFCLSFEYLQTAGYGKTFISPYFIRLGMGIWTK